MKSQKSLPPILRNRHNNDHVFKLKTSNYVIPSRDGIYLHTYEKAECKHENRVKCSLNNNYKVYE